MILYVSIFERFRLDNHTSFFARANSGLHYENPLNFFCKVVKFFLKIVHLQIIAFLFSFRLLDICRGFYQFLHSENTRSDAFTLYLWLAVLFMKDVTNIAFDKPFLSFMKFSSIPLVNRGKNLIVISHSRNLVPSYNEQNFRF